MEKASWEGNRAVTACVSSMMRVGFVTHNFIFLLRQLFSFGLSFVRTWWDAVSDAGAISVRVQLLFPSNNFIANHHLLAETAVPLSMNCWYQTAQRGKRGETQAKMRMHIPPLAW